MPRRVDYEAIAASYGRRYDDGRAKGRRDAVRQLAADPGVRRAVELGCGTGHWLDVLREAGVQAYGVDLSPGMLREGRAREAPCVCADACAVPFADETFGLAFCVNALHHFGDPAVAIAEAHRVLRVGGRFAVMGGSPHGRRDRWYGFEYFDGVWERDIARIPRWAQVAEWMTRAGFNPPELSVVERTHDPKFGRAVLTDPFLAKGACSQLALLSDDEYARGVERIERAVEAAEARGETARFEADFTIEMLSTRKAAP